MIWSELSAATKRQTKVQSMPRLRCYQLTDSCQLVELDMKRVIEAWNSDEPWPGECENVSVRLVTVRWKSDSELSDICLTRVRLKDGWITRAAVEEVRRAVETMPDDAPLLQVDLTDNPAAANVAGLPEMLFQISGWPPLAEMRRMLADCLDVPKASLPRLRVGRGMWVGERTDKPREASSQTQ